MPPQRVLHIFSSAMRAGVEMMVMNLYREIDRDKLQFDFVAHERGNNDIGPEIVSLGGRLFFIPLLSKVGVRRFTGILRGIIAENGPYAAVHAHTDYQGGFSAMAAKKAGVEIRICHAHTDIGNYHSPVFLAKKLLGRAVIARYATERCACSIHAGTSLYGKRAMEKGNIRIINNGIDLSGFNTFLPELREELRASCRAGKDTRLFGYIGRLSPEKNPAFILEMADSAKRNGMDCRFFIAGSGEMYEELRHKNRQKGLEDTVFFLGTREDIPSLMQCFDMVIIPSLAEGFSIVAVEAQAAGTPVLAAACVPKEADMGLDSLHFMRLEDGASRWMERTVAILDASVQLNAEKRIAAVRDKGFDVKTNIDTVMRLYGLS